MGSRDGEDDAFSRRQRRCEERYQVYLVGESFYQDAIHTICQGRTSSYADRVITKDATCAPGSENPEDPTAIRVTIMGRTVGHLSGSDSVRYRERFGEQPTTCRAMLLGGWQNDDGERAPWGVRLDLALHEKPKPATASPAPSGAGCGCLIAIVAGVVAILLAV